MLKENRSFFNLFNYNFFIIDLRLPILAAINLHLSAAEEAKEKNQIDLLEIELEKAEVGFDELNSNWPDDASQGLLKAMVDPLRERRDVLKKILPKNVQEISQDDPARISALKEEAEKPEE